MPEKPPVQILGEKLMEARGLDYSLAYEALKEHLRGLSDMEFLDEMVKVTEPDIFKYLWSVGLSFRQMQLARQRWEELTE